jgi:PAS domain S-box-containing protein
VPREDYVLWGNLLVSAAVGLAVGVTLVLLLGRRWLFRPVLEVYQQAQAKRSKAERDGLHQDLIAELREGLDKLARAQRVAAPPVVQPLLPAAPPSALPAAPSNGGDKGPSAREVSASVSALTQEWRSLSGQLEKVASFVKRLEEGRSDRSEAERTSAEQARRESAERVRAVIEACPVPIALCRTSDGMLLNANADFARMLGRASEPLAGRSLPDLLAEPADREQLRRALVQQIPVRDLDVRSRKRDGEQRVLSLTLQPLNLDGQPSALAALADMTDRKRAETALSQGLSLLTATLESTADGILVVDRAGKIVTYNQKLLEMWRIPETALRGATEQDLLMSLLDQLKDPDAFLRTARKTAQDPESESSDVLQFRDGRMFERYSVPQRVGTEVIGRVWSFRDLTERSWAEQALIESEEQLLHSQKMEAIGRLAGGVAHDLNNLLTVITGYAQFLLDALKPDSAEYRDADEIRQATKRAEALIQQLLAFSRKQPRQPRRLDLNDLVNGLSRMLQRLLGVEIRLVTALSPVPSPVLVDQNQISQVIMNLVVNARDAMPKGGMVTVETANLDITEASRKGHSGLRPGPHVLLAVCDTGVGMDANTLAHCYEPFFTTKPIGQGTGLGLSTVYGIVKQSDGVIEIQSEPGRGTAVRIHFPRLELEEALDSTPPSVASMPSGTETILLVEDEEKVRHLVRKVIEQQGYTVLEAESGPAALQLVRDRSDVDLLVTDVVMPEMSGPELATQLSGRRPGLKVLFISGYTDDASVHRGLAEGTPMVLQKPFSPAELAHKIREVLDTGASK